jgi:hypothetical protein
VRRGIEMRQLVAFVLVILLLGAVAVPAAARSPTATGELLSGMVTEEVEAGVFRVIDDGYREVSHPDEGLWGDDAVMVTGTGDVWRITPPRRLFRLGQEELWDYDPGLVDIGKVRTEAGPDGRLWTIALRSVRVFDGTSWRRPSESHDIGGDFEAIAVGDDGTVWLLAQDSLVRWPPDGEPQFEGWTDVFEGWVFLVPPAVTGDGEAWLMGTDEGGGDIEVFMRFDGTDWQVIAAPAGVDLMPTLGSSFDVGPDGVLWTTGDAGPLHRSLARLDDDGWTIFSAADGVEPWGEQPMRWFPTDVVRVAPDENVWVNATDETTHTCDGLARFDGETWQPFLSGRCISDLDFAPDGSVWVVAREPHPAAEVDTYVITPEAVAAKG